MLESCEYLTSKIVNNIVLNPQTLNIFVANNFDVPDAGTMYLFARIYSQAY